MRNHRLAPLSKTLLEVEVDGLALFATHLASRHEEQAHPREGEVRAILGVLGRVAVPHPLVGDFNALQPGDRAGDPPAGVEPRGDALPDAPWLRLDYAFASPELAPRLAACDVVARDLAAGASDHLPFVVELRS